MRSNSCAVPIVVLFAISEVVLSVAVTYLLSASALRLTVPLELLTSWKVSHWPATVRLAISGSAPAASAVTSRPLAWARSAMSPVPWLI